MILAACSGSPSAPSTVADGDASAPPPAPVVDAGAPPPDAHVEPDPSPLDVRVEGRFVRALQPAVDGYLALLEKPLYLMTSWGLPDRVAVVYTSSGREIARREPTAGRQLIDVAAHPSGAMTVLEASDEGWFLVRLDETATLRSEVRLADIERATHDSGRIVAEGEAVFVGLRRANHSVAAYRVGPSSAGLTVRTETVVVPPHGIAATGLTGGSYDTFGQLDAHYGVFVALDGSGIGYVGVSHARLESGAMVKAHQKAFGETLATDPDYLDAFVTRIDGAGKRLGTSVISTPDDEQLYALRAERDGVFALGRSEHWNAAGTGFDALVAHVDGAGVVTVRTFDVDRGDIAFDALRRKDGALVVVGTSGYSQNPSGASISEEGHAFARLLRPDGGATAIELPTAARHNEARFVVIGPDRSLLIGGMLDGPGTHSADGDHTLLRATGWITTRRETPSLVP